MFKVEETTSLKGLLLKERVAPMRATIKGKNILSFKSSPYENKK